MSDARGLARRRMGSVRLEGTPFERPQDVVRWFGGVQSQDYGPAKWSLGQRLSGVTDAQLDRAFDAGDILRTHVLRPTWHFVAPEDLRWMLQLTAPRVHALNAFYCRQVGLDTGMLDRGTALIAAELEGGNQLTRKELAAMLERAGIVTKGLQQGYLFMHAELNGVICSGALSGRQHTYARLEDRVPAQPPLTPEAALADTPSTCSIWKGGRQLSTRSRSPPTTECFSSTVRWPATGSAPSSGSRCASTSRCVESSTMHAPPPSRPRRIATASSWVA